MKNKVWALVTGAIRNTLYLRVMLVKLCDLRFRGIIEGIVLSTWKGEVDRYDGLRDQLKMLNVSIVETKYIDESNEFIFNQPGYARQATTIERGIKIIPFNCFVLRLRTDFNSGIKYMFDLIMEDECYKVKRFGEFPIALDKKIVMQAYGWSHLLFPNDRFFLASKEDMSKLCLPVQNKKVRDCGIFVESELLIGYAYLFYPFFRNVWNVIPIDFYEKLHGYCMSITEEELVLPRIIYRIYATMCVYLYTQVHLLDGNPHINNELVHVIELFRGRVSSNCLIEKLIKGYIFDSKAAFDFKDELRKLALNLPETHGYSYEEYLELKSFAKKKLHIDKLKEYPFVRNDEMYLNKNKNVDKGKACDIMFDQIAFKDMLLPLINDDLNSFGELYSNLKSDVKDTEDFFDELIQTGVFDSDTDCILEYFKRLSNGKCKFDSAVWNQALRYLSIKSNGGVKKEFLLAIYYALISYRRLYSQQKAVRDSMGVITRIATKQLSRVFGRNITFDSTSVDKFVETLIISLQNCRETVKTENIIVIKTLLDIHPHENPFSEDIISVLHDKGDELEKIIRASYDMPYKSSDWVISQKLSQLLCEKNHSGLISYAREVSGTKDVEALIRYFWYSYWQLPSERPQISSIITDLSGKISKTNFIVKVNAFLTSNNINLSREDLIERENFEILLEALSAKNCLRQNAEMVFEMCFGEFARKMLFFAFLRFESDKRLGFFSMKNGHELWVHYMPYLNNDNSKYFEVPMWSNDLTWPGADRKNKSAFAAYMTLMGNNIFISIEFNAKDSVKTRMVAEKIGFDVENSPGALVRLETKKIPFEGESDLAQSVNDALDDYCKIGEKLVAALEQLV